MSSETSVSGMAPDSSVVDKQAKATVDVKEAIKDLESIKHAHQYDPNLPQEKLDFLNKALQDGDADEIIESETFFTEDSPYAEVRAAVRNTDGGEVANTVRAWVLGSVKSPRPGGGLKKAGKFTDRAQNVLRHSWDWLEHVPVYAEPGNQLPIAGSAAAGLSARLSLGENCTDESFQPIRTRVDVQHGTFHDQGARCHRPDVERQHW